MTYKGGAIMSVAAILTRKGTHVETTRPQTTLNTVVWELKTKNIGALVVTADDESAILGIVSERDIVRHLTEQGAQWLAYSVSDVMVTPVLTCTPDERITAVMARMTKHRVRHLPVVVSGKLAGIVSIGDVVRYRLDELELEANVLREQMILQR
jgi:CBS domain-containing protein